MSSTAAPIAVFDSGLGGLTVLSALSQRLPAENFIYFADTHYLPYGDKSAEFIEARCLQVADYFMGKGAKALVMACNTATAVAADAVRAAVKIPVIAIEPAVKPAVLQSRTGVIAVLATVRTLASLRFQKLVLPYEKDTHIIAIPCPGLAEAIEAEGGAGAEVDRLLDSFVLPLNKENVDVVVLGCTHYPWVAKAIADRLPDGVLLLDTGEAVARQLQRRLAESGLLRSTENETLPISATPIVTSGDVAEVKATLNRLYAPTMPWQVKKAGAAFLFPFVGERQGEKELR